MEDERYEAQKAARQAVKTGGLLPPRERACASCGATAQVYHHHLGYAVEHRLDVVPLCRRCHDREHPERAAAAGASAARRRPRPVLRRLRHWRQQRAMSQKELGASAGVTEATVWRLETGEYAANPKTVRKLAAALGVEPDALYGEEGRE